MKENDQKIKVLLEQKLDQTGQNPPDLVWDNIEQELFTKRKRRFLFWWFVPAVIVVAMLFFFAGGDKNGRQKNAEETLIFKCFFLSVIFLYF
jgi:hypothetical protein